MRKNNVKFDEITPEAMPFIYQISKQIKC